MDPTVARRSYHSDDQIWSCLGRLIGEKDTVADGSRFLCRELQRENVWSRIHLVPLLLAEGDRDAYRRQQAALAREKEIMKDVKDWEVCAFISAWLCGIPRPVADEVRFLICTLRWVGYAGRKECIPQSTISTGGQHCGAMTMLLFSRRVLPKRCFSNRRVCAERIMRLRRAVCRKPFREQLVSFCL